MPYNPGTGIYTLPAIYLAVAGTTILAAQHNTPLEDLEVANNYARPIIAGGTGANSVPTASVALGWTKGANVASAAALPVGTVENYMHVTGVAAITSISTRVAGQWLALEFEGALVLTHNATSLILPGGANITTAAGDVAIFVSEGAGNWRCMNYLKVANGPTVGPIEVTPGVVTSSLVTGVPAWVTEIDILINGLSLNGAASMILQLGDSGGIEAAGYTNTFATLKAGAVANLVSTSSFLLSNALAASAPNGLIQLRRTTAIGFQWNMVYMAADGDTVYTSGGVKATSAALDRFQIGSNGGVQTFDSGTFSYKWR